MEDNLSVLVDAKTEYTKQLTNILVPFIYEGIKSIYEENIEHCKVTDDRAILMRFQEKLSLVPKWSQEILGQECERIMSGSGCDWLDELVTAVFLSHTKILTAIKKNGKKQKKINLKIPKIDHFIHKCYIECAREFWRNPYLYSERCLQSEYQRNVRESHIIIRNTIEETIRRLLPVKNILKEYLGEDEDSDKETSFISDNYRDNLRKIVKKEIEICQGKNDMTINGQSDSELITEESENLEKQEEIETIKEIINNELYEKDLTKDEPNENDNVIDLDDIEEISLSLNNKIEESANLENANDLEVPIEQLSAPVEELSAPIEELSAPVEASVEELSAPIEELSAPVEEVSAPIEEVSAPVEEVSAPVEEVSAPMEQARAPVVEESTPSKEEKPSTELENSNVEEENTPSEVESSLVDNLNLQEEEIKSLNDYSDDEVDVSKLNLKKMDLGSLNVEEINFDNDDFNFDLTSEPLVEINESNSLDEVKQELEPDTSNIKKIVIDDGKSSNLKKYTKDVKKNYSFFD